ncbi:MAG: response regulator [Thermodesulfobacteriota bacterium]|nr:response regulator [Thermodesulfobacteriota bacterium]
MDILVVEDDPHLAQIMKNKMEGWGHHVEASATRKGALEKVAQRKFDLALLDVFLPDGKGHHLIPQFRAQWPDMGIVTITGHNTRELEWEVRRQGIAYFMTKPFEAQTMKQIIDHISQKRGDARR